MYKLLLFFIASYLIACGAADIKNEVGKVSDLEETLKETDRQFSKMVQEAGVAEAFSTYADVNAIKLENRSFPVVGRDSIRQLFMQFPKDASFSWEPYKTGISSDGELGYTVGEYQIKTKTPDNKDTTVFGIYFSIWKKQENGDYKYVVDGGGPLPGSLSTVWNK